ncbi:suppressor of fused domain protein [Mesorhizobium sp. M2D.F.Ca.ET.223.01.1.1]|uniref:suppressor of fused domain protein n=2 Tax=Mesorhizobium TaxID=68287 RepID=UPI000FCB469E|nr:MULTISPECIES: suppressor of fused domain protein [unclassified Mesorhizobium]TGP84843.1 suppressor of fused domain protein [bacterium M00.F.Ca.ET.221.01.1.1]TGP88413.1 suppressor of fused domain protein [bacterium M00.F.Ca.ET.222.01.1.1]RVD55906.1 suppressor of fused domain protein [Mesorhizobium sp. M2D.F.Ca.ET.140.01.1.1]TGP71047.1 suppressor of fused domain protein [Mesorhizobium sp. M2D.F.Ca.ET.224.01.1.1]TGR87443.1 suppressor of fused domain protein [Mesorhizobium sp. M2D.F.Ca.ET.223.0
MVAGSNPAGIAICAPGLFLLEEFQHVAKANALALGASRWGGRMNLEEVWRIREEDVYPALFGGDSRGIFVLSSELFQRRFGVAEVDPRWLFYGVFEHAPRPQRPYWLYVTSGHSNPWEQEEDAYDPEGESGAGVEFILASTEQGDWAIRCLQNLLAFDLLLGAGHFGGRGPLGEGDRIPLRSPINGVEGCEVRNVVVVRTPLLPSGFTLPSGRVEFFTFVGMTDRELDFAKESGNEALLTKLSSNGFFPVTDPRRQSVI